MRLCSYIVTNDHGLAPNPFWEYCTLAVCTPNHMGIRAAAGDWFVGIASRQRGNKLLYAMQVSEVISFEQYDTDPRFESKNPYVTVPGGSGAATICIIELSAGSGSNGRVSFTHRIT